MAKRSNKTTTAAPTAAQIQARVLETFAYHCGDIMSAIDLNGFGLNAPGAEVFVTMKIVARDASNSVGDTVEVNGVRLGSRTAARNEYARLCAPVIAAAFAAK